MSVDRLQALLQRFTVNARMFHSGPLCGVHLFDDRDGLGQLHLIKRGPVEVRHGSGGVERLFAPSLVFYPRPIPHRFITDAEVGADMACANLEFGPGRGNPIGQALPAVVTAPLSELPAAQGLLEVLFDEAFASRCGRQQVVDRLFEVVLVLLLRHLLDCGRIQAGPLAGLGHPQLARALAALHDAPERPWTLAELAARAGMSRSHFAKTFAGVVGTPPGNYLASYRMVLVQDELRQGRSLETIAGRVGYGSGAALSRAFHAHCGMSPRAWKRMQA